MTQEEADFVNGRTEKKEIEVKHPDTHYRTKEIEKRINDKFNLIYGEYNEQKRPDESKYEDKNFNLELFSKKNAEWKQFCWKICKTQKLVAPNLFAFQNKVARDQGKPEPVTVEIKQGEIEPNVEKI